MNFIVENWYLVLLVLVSGAMLLVPMIKEGGGAGLSAAMAVQLINREKAVVIDVCGAAEYAEYAAIRRDLALPQNELLALNPLNSIGKQLGAHPNMPEVQALFEAGKLSFVANVGTARWDSAGLAAAPICSSR